MVLVFGTVCLDRIRRVHSFPSGGGYVEVLTEHESLGGEAANTASALVLWRIEVALAGNALGLGHDGERLRMHVLEKGISDEWLGRAGVTPICDVYVGDDGDRTMFGAGFGTMAPSVPVDHLPYTAGSWFTAETNMRSAAEEALRCALQAGMYIYAMDFFQSDGVVPPGSVSQFSTDWVGERGNSGSNMAWIEAWSERHGATGILTDGAEGLFLAHPGEGAIALDPFPAPVTVDSTGAGDVFRAGVLRSLELGESLGDGLAFGAAAAAIKVGTLGANEGLPTLSGVEAHRDASPEIRDAFRRVPDLPWRR